MKFEFSDEPSTVDTPTGPVLVRPYQIVLNVRIANSSPFPAILDTGHNHNFSISEKHLKNWVGGSYPEIGRLKLGDQHVPLIKVNLFLEHMQLDVPEGVALFPNAPRLPLLGLRALARNRLTLSIDGKRLRGTIRRSW